MLSANLVKKFQRKNELTRVLNAVSQIYALKIGYFFLLQPRHDYFHDRALLCNN